MSAAAQGSGAIIANPSEPHGEIPEPSPLCRSQVPLGGMEDSQRPKGPARWPPRCLFFLHARAS